MTALRARAKVEGMGRGQPPVEPAPARRGDPLASVSRRSLAWILDVVLVTLLIFVAVSVTQPVVPWKKFEPGTSGEIVAFSMLRMSIRSIPPRSRG